MNSHLRSRPVALFVALLLTASAGAQVPGEDPVVLKNVAPTQMRPMGSQPQSGSLDGDPNMPAWVRARITRYEAKAFSANPGSILTDSNVVTTSSAQGMQKVCSQEIGSTTTAAASPGMKYGPQPTSQIVVLRGDLVNICN
jgi:hypothetical protein